MKHSKPHLVLALPLLVAGCLSTGSPAGSPDRVAADIVRALDDERPDAAADLFEDVSEHEDYRQQIYPVLYETAQDRYVRGDGAGAARLLSFLSDEYADAQAVERALLYSLFLERGQESSPDAELNQRLRDSVNAVRSQSRPPLWVDLVETQLLIDQGRLSEALDTFERFAGSWDGQPEALAVYVEDIQRYLASH